MDVWIALFFDVTVDHDIVDAFWAALFVALFGGIGWLLNRGFARMENRHKRAEDKLEDLDDNISDVRYNHQLPPWRARKDREES